MTRHRGRTSHLLILSMGVGILLAGCGGGGGGGGSGGGPGGDNPPAANVSFEGFTFKVGDGAPTAGVPKEDLSEVPPMLGAPLDVTLIFNFSGVPQGPFNQQNLPVYTTPEDVTPLAGASGGTPVISAKGSYVLVGNTVEFRPFVPTEPLQVELSAPSAAVPGLLPGSTYTIKVVTAAGLKIPNLKGGGGLVKFDTTSLEAGYFTGDDQDGLGPQVVATQPADGATGFSPGPFSNFAPGSDVPSFPEGDTSFMLTFDRALQPTTENLEGKDWDGDGYIDPNFFLRAQGTRLIVAQTVPADSSIGNSDAFPALSGLTAGAAVPADGDAIFLHDSQGVGALPGADPALSSTPSSVATARDPSLLFIVLRIDGGGDTLTVADHVLGDPTFTDLAAAGLGTGLQDLVALTTLLDGRLVTYDRATRRIWELMPTVTRMRPVGEPVLTALDVGDGTDGFVSSTFPVGQDVLDLAQSPNGDLYALLDVSGAVHLQRLTPIDPNLDGAFVAGEGLPDGSAPLVLAGDYAAIAFLDETSLLILDRGNDRIDTLDVSGGITGTAVSDVAAYGVPLGSLPDGLSPALDLAVGFMELDVTVAMLSNDAAGAVVQLEPAGVLPIGSQVDVMLRNTLASASGVSAANQDPAASMSVLGAARALSVATSLPLNTVGPCSVPDPDDRVNDVVDELFQDGSLEDTQPTGLSPLAEWATPTPGGGSTGHLRASVGVDEAVFLGDFLPQAKAGFDPGKAYSRSISQVALANFNFLFLDTDAQNFPLPNGETPNVTQSVTIFGGQFTFHDFIIPEGVWVTIKGSQPLTITATGRVEIAGVLDIAGTNGQDDITFDSAIFPVPGGAGGPGAGRGGDGHPTISDPTSKTNVGGLFATPYATPETGENGFGPVVTPTGIQFEQVGGRGGLSTLGYKPDDLGYPELNQLGQGPNTEHHRPPGGGGGSFYFHGIKSHQGTGSYRVQSGSSFGNFTLCPTNDKIHDSLYGNEESQYCFGNLAHPLQCVYMQGTPEDPERFQPAADPGELVFSDGDASNDYFGGEGEMQVLIGGQGGGGGGTRIDSMMHLTWAANQQGGPFLPAIVPCYPPLLSGFFASPTLYDAKGGGAGGGGGAVLIRSFGDILVTRTGHIDASGGDGGGGEIIGNSNFSGAGGGGSGGAIILQAAGEITVEADSNHRSQWYTDANGAQGAALDVSGGLGWDARTKGQDITNKPTPEHEFTRSDGGQGGFGLIQLQDGSGDGMPTVQQGAFLFARQRGVIKRFKALTPDTLSDQKEHPDFDNNNKPPDILRYIDILYYRSFKYDAADTLTDIWWVLNGSDPPIIEVTNPADIGPYQLDTAMIDYFGRRVVKEPEPSKILREYNGYDSQFIEIGPDGQLPGTAYLATDEIPFSIHLKEPDGTPLTQVIDGVEQFDPDNIVDRLPVVHPSKTPPEFGTVSRGTSKWLDFNGVALRLRDASGIAPPLFSPGFNGTYNDLLGVPPPGKDGQIVTANPVPGVPAHFVANTGFPPFDPGLCGNGAPPDPAYNDVKVDSPEFALDNVVTDNATVTVQFQGAFAIRAGSHVPDPDTLSAWVSDVRELSGYPLVRFQVVFDVSVDSDLYPFNVNSMRPAVDELRMRVKY